MSGKIQPCLYDTFCNFYVDLKFAKTQIFNMNYHTLGPTKVTIARKQLKTWIDVIALMMFKTTKKNIVGTWLDTTCVWKLLSGYMC